MIVTVTAKVKIKPTETQAEAMLDTFGHIASLLSQRSKHLTYRHLRNTCGFRSQMAQSVMKKARLQRSQMVLAYPHVQGNRRTEAG